MGLHYATLRNAIDLACEKEGGCAEPSRISCIYKALTPGSDQEKVTVESIQAAGFPVTFLRRPDQHPLNSRPYPVVHRIDDGTAMFRMEHQEVLQAAYRFAAAGTKHGPGSGLVEFSLFSSAMHMLDPSLPAGKKLRSHIAKDPLWHITGHYSRKEVHGHEIQEVDEDADEDADEMCSYRRCSAETPGAYPVTWIERDAKPTYFVRPTGEDEQPHTLEAVLPDGSRRMHDVRCSLPSTLQGISRIPTFLVTDGTRLEIRRLSGALLLILTYSSERDLWLTPGGEPMHVPAYDGYHTMDETQGLLIQTTGRAQWE